jgi:hypothetical protein
MNERKAIESAEERLRSKLNPKRLAPYGVGGSGYEALSDYLNGDRELDDSVRKQIYEYRVFLAILKEWVDPSDVEPDDIIFFSPSKGTGNQFETAPSLFVEPVLPVYPEDDLWNRNQSKFNYLKSPSESPKRHTKPDLLLTRPGVDNLPWTANVRAPAKNESKLMSWCAKGKFDKVKQELNIEDEIPSARECYSIVQNTDKKEPADAIYKKWDKFRHNSEFLIELKHDPLKESDFSQILWYGIVYRVDVIIVSKYPVSDHRFQQDLRNLPVNVTVVDGFDITLSPQEASKKLAGVL